MGAAIILLITNCYRKIRTCYIDNAKLKIISQFDTAQREQWNLNDRQAIGEDIPAECALCNLEFKERDSVVTLKCNDSHVFHRHCFSKYVK